MQTTFLDRINYFFSKGFDIDTFENYPTIHKAFNNKKFEDFKAGLIRELDIEIINLLNNDSTKASMFIQKFESIIKETFAEGSRWDKQFILFDGLNTLPYSYFPQLNEIATACLTNLHSYKLKH